MRSPLTSLPRGIPLPRAQVRPMTLATNVLKVRYSFSTTPLRMVFISGIPDPATRQEGVIGRNVRGGEGRGGGGATSWKRTIIHMEDTGIRRDEATKEKKERKEERAEGRD